MADPTFLKTTTSQSNEQVIAELEDLLHMAKNGELLSIAVCGVLTGGRVLDQVVGWHDTVTLLGASVIMQDTIKSRFPD